MRVLIVEDAGFAALTFKDLLPGHDVICVQNFVALRPDLHAVKHDGSHVLLRKHIDVAFVDGACGCDFDGPRIVAELTKRGTICIGMSNDGDANADMAACGAVLNFQKPVALAALALGLLPIERLPAEADAIEDGVHASPEAWDYSSSAHRSVGAIMKKHLRKEEG